MGHVGMVIDEVEVDAPSSMGVLEAIRGRRSIGAMLSNEPPREAIETILDAATWAPNHRVTEPWRFFVLTGRAREALGEVMASSKLAGKSGADEAFQKEFERARAKPLRAPVVIAVAVEPAVGPKIVEIEEIAAGAAAIQNMLLAAHAIGLAAIWRTGDPCFDPAVKAFFDLPTSAHLLGFVYVGYPAATSTRARRTPATEFTRWMDWDDEVG